MNDTNTQTVEEPPQPWSPKNPGEGQDCPDCGRHFKNQMALRMHRLRKHTPGRGWNTSGNLRHTRLTPVERNRRRRARNIAAGLTGEGRTRHRAHSESREYKKAYYEKRRNRFYQMGLNARGVQRAGNQRLIVLGSESQPQPELNSVAVNYCPHCGTNIRKFLE